MASTSTCVITMPTGLSDAEKMFLFNKVKDSVDATGNLSKEVHFLDYEKIMVYIEMDLKREECSKEFPLEVLSVFVVNGVHSVYMEVMRFFRESLFEKDLANYIMMTLNNRVKRLFINGDIKDLIKLYSAWQSYDLDRFSTSLSESFEGYNDILLYKKFLLTQIIPYVFTVKNHWDKTERIAIDLALTLTSIKSIVSLNAEEFCECQNNLERYLLIIRRLLEASFDSWPKLWTIVVKLFDTRLHTTPDLLKKMLEIVEDSINGNMIGQKIRGLDCWKVLIDNISLNFEYLIHGRNVNLLLAPLTLELGNDHVLIIKRFEVFKHLLMRLQNHSVLVLKQFLIFCFGEIEQRTERCYAKDVPKLYIGCAKVLLAILGHCHNNVGDCLETSTEIYLEHGLLEILKLKEYTEEYTHLYRLLINSVLECSNILQQTLEENIANRVLHCLWGSLINLLLQYDDQLEYVGELIGNVLDRLIMHDDQNNRNLCAIIFKAIVSYTDLSKVTPIVLRRITILVQVIFTVPLSKDSTTERLMDILSRVNSLIDRSTLLKYIYECFNNFKTVDVNADFVARLWVILTEHIKDCAEGDSINYLVWPVLHFNHITHPEIKENILIHYNCKLVPSVEKSDPLHLKLFQYFKTSRINDVARLKLILSIITWFNPKITNKEILDITLEIIHSILLTTNTAESAQTVESYIRTLYESYVRVGQDAFTMQKLYSCIKDLLKFKYFAILSDVETFLKTSPDAIKLVHNKFLTIDFLTNISLDKETKLEIGEQISRLIDLCQDAKGTKKQKFVKRVLPSGGRSARIAALITDISASFNSTLDKSVNDTPIPECELKITKNTDGHNSMELKDKQKSKLIRNDRPVSPSTSPRILRSRKSMTDKPIVENFTESDPEDTQTQETALSDAEVVNVQFKLDLPQKPILTESEEIISKMDTASMHLDSQLFMDFNKSANYFEDIAEDSNKVGETEALTDIELTAATPIFAAATCSSSSSSAVVDKTVLEVPLKSPTGEKATTKTVGMRIFSQATRQTSLSGKPEPIRSPSSRTQKLMSNLKLLTPLPENIAEVAQQEQEENVLTFNRPLPSPLALPKGSILKRKSVCSPANQSSKRRRVGFSDTTEKVFIVDQPETSKNVETSVETEEENINNQLLEDSELTYTETEVTDPSTHCHNVPVYAGNEEVDKSPELDVEVEMEEELIRLLEKAKSKGLSIETLVNNCVRKCCPQPESSGQQPAVAATHSQNTSNEKLDLIENWSMQELGSVIWDSIQNGLHDRKTFLETCIFPYIEPMEWTQMLINLSPAEVVRRLNDDDFGEFIKKILANCTEQCKISVLSNYSMSQLTSNIIERATHNEIINAISEMFLKSNRNRITNMFRIVTDHLIAELSKDAILNLLTTALKNAHGLNNSF